MQPSDPEDPYKFITNPERPKRQISFGNTLQQRMLIVGIGLVLLVITFVLVLSLFNRASNAQRENLINLAQSQAEIIRITEIAEDESRDANTRSLAVNVKLTLDSDLQQTQEFLANRGTEIERKNLELKKDETTDEALETAKANSRFDEVFTEILSEQLEDYRALVRQAYEDGSPSEQEAMDQNYQEVGLFL